MDYRILRDAYFKGGIAPELTTSTHRAAQWRQLKKSSLMAKDIALMLGRFSKLIVNPSDISPIFKGQSFLNHKSFKISLESFRADPATAELLHTRYLAPEAYNLDSLLKLPSETLGHAFASHMKHYALEQVFYPPLEATENDDIAYWRKRARQTHDIHHVVLGFPAIDAGEMAISAFYLAQHNVPLSALLLGFGFLYTILREPERIDELMRAIQRGWAAGKQADKLMGVKWEELWEVPLDEVRQRLKVPAPVGVFP
jgi:ubiquinone biosynthesis protein COQ4